MSLTGLYFDGHSAARHRVSLVFEADALGLSEDGHVLARWLYAALRRVTPEISGELRLTAEGAGEARLVVSDTDAIDTLKRVAPHLFRGTGTLAKTLRLAVIGGALSAAFIAAVYFGLPPLSEWLVRFVPPRVEARVGDNAYHLVSETWSDCAGAPKAAAASAVLASLAHRLTAGTEIPFPLSVDVIDMKIENAFALPGGHVILTRDLVERAESPDELAGVLAHELGHVAERHPMLGMLQQMGLSFFTSLIVGGGSNSGEFLVSGGVLLTTFAYTRRLEARADKRALGFLAAAHVSPLGFAQFFDRVDAEAKDEAAKNDPKAGKLSAPLPKFDLPDFMSTHPPSPARAALAREAAGASGPFAPALSAAEWATVKAACAPPPEAAPAPEAPSSAGKAPAAKTAPDPVN